MYLGPKSLKMHWKQPCLAITILLLGQLSIGLVEAQILTYEVHLKDLLKLQKGLGWPPEMLVAEGQEALMKLTATLPDQQSCTVTTPRGETFDITSPPSNRYQQWSDGCGLRVRQIAESDTGRWRLTATSESDSLTGWIEVEVNGDTSNYTGPPISLQDGQTQTNVELTTLDNSYCVVSQPFTESSLVPGHCHVTLDKTTRAVQGNWNVLVGLPGQISELRVQRQVAVQAERLDVGYIHDSAENKIHLYCNILHTEKNITFCRFQKTSNPTGFNVMEGLSDGAHSYYGNGFVAKECGLTIEQPTGQDYGTWRCSVGSQQWEGVNLVQQTPMQALVNVDPDQRNLRGLRNTRSDAEEVRSVFVQKDETFTLTCQVETALSYCWFLHPNGSQYSPVTRTSETSDQLFWYSGESLQTGDCGITFTHADDSDSGNWICHMGISNQLGVELSERIDVRVTGPLAANTKDIDVAAGQNATLHCHTSNGNRPLDYCRFLTPDFVGINIDDTVTQENPIMDRFYFLPERSLQYGDCSLVISSVQPEDVGRWSCAARINGDAMESSDTIDLNFSETSEITESTRAPLSRAGIVGMIIGSVALIVLLAGVVWHRVGRPVPWRRQRGPDTISMPFDLMSMNTRTVSRGSTHSGNDSLGSDTSLDAIEGGNTSAQQNPQVSGDPLRTGNV